MPGMFRPARISPVGKEAGGWGAYNCLAKIGHPPPGGGMWLAILKQLYGGVDNHLLGENPGQMRMGKLRDQLPPEGLHLASF